MNENFDLFRKYRDELINQFKVLHSNIAIVESGEIPLPDLREAYGALKHDLQEKIADLETKEFRVAFVGGFNSGKSTLINAIIGEYILPEANRALTSVPTHLKRSNSDTDEFYIRYLSREEVVQMKRMYREALAQELGDPAAKDLGDDGVIAAYERRVQAIQNEGRVANLDPQLLNHFREIHKYEKEISSKIRDEPYIAPCDRTEAFRLIQDNIEGAFIDRIEIKLRNLNIPNDVVIVDLPGVSVPNPRHRSVTIDFITKNAHAVVLVLHAKKILERDENSILKNYIGVSMNVQNKLFWVINHWDTVTDADRNDVEDEFERVLKDFKITNPRIYKTSARDGLLSILHINREAELHHDRLQKHLKDYQSDLHGKYNDSHQVAYERSHIKDIREDLLTYLNADIKRSTLTEMTDFVLLQARRIIGVLQKAQTDHQHYLAEIIDQDKVAKQENELSKKKKALVDKAKDTLETIQHKVVDEGLSIQAMNEKVLWQSIKETYSGDLNLQREFFKVMSTLGRQTPVYFEIETKVLTGINSLIRNKFVEAQKQGIDDIFEEYEILLAGFSKFISDTLKGEYVAELHKSFKDAIITQNRNDLRMVAELSSNELMSDLDKIMIWSDVSEQELFGQMRLDSWERVIESTELTANQIRHMVDSMKPTVHTVSKKWILWGKDRDNLRQIEQKVEEIYRLTEKISATKPVLHGLLTYAYPVEPDPARQLTAIAKIVPNGRHHHGLWTQKADAFKEFLEKVYKKHMTEVVAVLNRRTWLNVRDALAKTGEKIDELLATYVFYRLERIVKDSVEGEFRRKREEREKLQGLIGSNLKPFSDAEGWLKQFKDKVVEVQ